MGLDMYLFKKAKGEDFESCKRIAYWRKANQVRQWIVENTNYPAKANCEYHKLSKQQIEKLIADCQKILKNNDNKLAEKLMPTKGGQKIDLTSMIPAEATLLTPPVIDTFGSTAYDNSYFAELLNTVSTLKAALNATDFKKEEIYYYECW